MSFEFDVSRRAGFTPPQPPGARKFVRIKPKDPVNAPLAGPPLRAQMKFQSKFSSAAPPGSPIHESKLSISLRTVQFVQNPAGQTANTTVKTLKFALWDMYRL